MARKSIAELVAQATADFPDNVTSLITPAKLRQFVLDFLATMSPGYGYITLVGPTTQTFGLTAALTVFSAAADADPSQTTSTVPASTVARAEKGMSCINFSLDFEAANGRNVSFTVFKNNVATPWRITGNGGGAGNAISVALTAMDYNSTPATYKVMATADINGVSTIMTNGVFIVQLVPVRVFT